MVRFGSPDLWTSALGVKRVQRSDPPGPETVRRQKRPKTVQISLTKNPTTRGKKDSNSGKHLGGRAGRECVLGSRNKNWFLESGHSFKSLEGGGRQPYGRTMHIESATCSSSKVRRSSGGIVRLGGARLVREWRLRHPAGARAYAR